MKRIVAIISILFCVGMTTVFAEEEFVYMMSSSEVDIKTLSSKIESLSCKPEDDVCKSTVLENTTDIVNRYLQSIKTGMDFVDVTFYIDDIECRIAISRGKARVYITAPVSQVKVKDVKYAFEYAGGWGLIKVAKEVYEKAMKLLDELRSM